MDNKARISILVKFLITSLGISIGWPVGNLSYFAGVLPLQESRFCQMFYFGGAVGSLVFGFGLKFTGRKILLLFSQAILILSKVIFIVAGHLSNTIYAMEIISGFACGGCLVVAPIFLTEITPQRNRVVLNQRLTLFVVSLSMGIAAGCISSSILHPIPQTYWSIVFIGILICLLAWIPESPEYLKAMKRADEAEVSNDFYGNGGISSLEEATEVEVLEYEDSSKIKMDDFKDPAVYKAMILSMGLFLFSATSGVLIIVNHIWLLTSLINVEEFPMIWTLLTTALILIIGATVFYLLANLCGRRKLLIISGIGTSVPLFVITICSYLVINSKFGHLIKTMKCFPIVPLGATILFAVLGILTVPFIVLPELNLRKFLSLIYTLSMTLFWLISLLFTKLFLSAVWEVHEFTGVLLLFGLSCVIESVVVYLFLPETKNVSMGEVQANLRRSVIVRN